MALGLVMSNPKHNGPACAGFCEGSAYQIEIRQLNSKIAELEIESDRKTIATAWDKMRIAELEEERDQLQAAVSEALNAEECWRLEAESLQAAINRLADPAESFCEGDFPDYTDALRNEIDQRIEYAQQFATEVE